MCSNEDEEFLTLFFECDNTFSVVNSKHSGCRNVTDTMAEMLFKGRWYSGCIKYKGNLYTLINCEEKIHFCISIRFEK